MFYGRTSNIAAARLFLADRLQRGESVIFIAVADGGGGEAVAFAQLYPSFSSLSMQRSWILNDLFVLPEARRTGITRRLLDRVREFTIATDAAGLTLEIAATNEAARALYESCGWQRDEAFDRTG